MGEVEMSDSTLEWFRESFRQIRDDLSEIRSSLEKKSDDLSARASANRTDIERLRNDLDHGSRRIDVCESDIQTVVSKIGAVESCLSCRVAVADCNALRKECAASKILARENVRNWIVALVAISQLLLAAALAYYKLRS